MKKALIISHSEQSAVSLSELLRNENYTQISTSDNTKTARKLVENDEFDLICINAPLSEENGIELSIHFAKTTRACVVIIVPQKNADDVNDALQNMVFWLLQNQLTSIFFIIIFSLRNVLKCVCSVLRKKMKNCDIWLKI